MSFVMAATFFGIALVGGGLYEFLVVNPYWPARPDLVQPNRGGINRKRFWIPAHTVFEILLIVALVRSWAQPDVRFWLLLALGSHGFMRIWSAFDFIPKAMAFERSELVDEQAARKWARRSTLRFPFDLITCFALLSAMCPPVRGL